MRQEAVERVEFGPQDALDMIHSMDEPRIHLDLAAADNFDRPRLTDAGFVVAVAIGAHRHLPLALLGVEQFEDALGVLNGVAATADRAADRAGLDAALALLVGL